ncbi:hypothetical protein TD95_004945 [Thielaviopsis punctulata]|uniref:Peptidase S59 domain-containing protein n=1 Tax=Thielaviopsis punctulata TaxID=72032 RepID=A0A0F4ZI42_9PEZI|nr:hypothetical protein TD95_004945 [Thielaviopsis punctulata]
MSFGGFGGFGQANNTANNTGGFGGFGSNTNNTTSAFGSGGSTFGNTASSGFGSGGGFGSNTTSAFGANKPAFGASTTGGGLFGSSNTTTNNTNSAFGGFGSNTNTNPTGFGSNTGGGLFGNKPAVTSTFGSATTGGGGMFGGGNATNTGFGATNNPGIGNAGDPPGTNTTPFQAHQDKEGASTTTNCYQNILFQDAYRKWSADELRLVDYAQGRRFGNASGGGAFGVSAFGSGTTSGFGANNTNQTSAFGSTSTGGGLFGNNTSTTNNAFGSNNTTTSAFGGNSGGMFGSKPATTGGLFGTNTANTTTGGGLFGTNNATSNSTFGSGTTGAFGQPNNNTTGGGLFGNNAAKPATTGFGGFGTNTNTTTSGFGQQNNTPSAFGQQNTNTGGGLFGNNASNTNNTSGGGLFGGGNNATTTNAFGAANTGANTSGGLFGANNAAKPGGLFGSATTTTPAAGGGLFGNNNATTSNTSAFGATNTGSNGASTGGLFGAAKPAATGGLFGSNTGTAAPTMGGGLFGSTTAQPAAQPAATGGLFGGLGQAQAKPSLFGSTQPATTGAFGAQAAQPTGGLFGAAQPGTNILGQNSLAANQNAAAAGLGLNASINDVSAYGNASLFSGLSGGEVSNPGPLATPLSSKGKAKKNNVLPMYKLNPSSNSRYATPQKRGFGFSYSTYGAPGAPANPSTSPSGPGRNLLATSLSRGLTKSASNNTLRRNYGTEDSVSSTGGALATNSILAPGAFSSSSTSRFYGGASGTSSSNKKLVINRDVRSDLFSTPVKEKPLLESSATAAISAGSRKLSKRVSFETNGGEEGQQDVQPVVSKTRTSVLSNERTAKPITSVSLTEDVKNNELIVAQETETNALPPNASIKDTTLPGGYWTSPSLKELRAMSRLQRQAVPNFTVGRENVGQLQFKVPVDLSNIDLDDFLDNIVILETRSATVYPIAEKKPPMGRGLNVPAHITLEHSWPRGNKGCTDPKRIAKHIERLRRIADTTFENYDPETGVWEFSVEHFTTYGLDDGDESEADSEISALPPKPRANLLDPVASSPVPSSDIRSMSFSPMEGASGTNDTFEFRHGHRAPPGSFAEYDSADYLPPTQESFLGISSVGSASNQIMLSVEHSDLGYEYASSDGEDMAGLAVSKHRATEPYKEDSSAFSEAMDEDSEVDVTEEDEDSDSATLEAPGGGVIRARMRALKTSAGPVRVEVTDGDDWLDMLQKTVAPVKRNQLNEIAVSSLSADAYALAQSKDEDLEPLGIVGDGHGFATTIDLMNSLFERSKPKPQSLETTTSAQTTESPEDLPPTTRVRWGPDGKIVLSSNPAFGSGSLAIAHNQTDIFDVQQPRFQNELPGIRFVKFSTEKAAPLLENHMRMAKISTVNGIPKASLEISSFKSMFQDRNTSDVSVAYEKLVWDLASILFDDTENTTEKARKDKLSAFWTELVATSSTTETAFSKSADVKAVASLAGHRVQEACKHLLDGKNFHLATLVSLIGTDESLKLDMKEQLNEWKEAMMLSEFSDAVRAIYEMLAGNVGVCEGEGVKGLPPQDRVEQFVISQKFSLNWMQAFGLRLWYATAPNDDLVVAVHKFYNDIKQSREPLPQPWFVKEGVAPLWHDENQDQRQDLLWGLLALYAEVETKVEAAIRPENSQVSPLNWRLSWQLGQALVSATGLTFGENSDVKSDSATLSFASQLLNEGSWLQAVFVLLHLSNSDARAKAIRDVITQHAGFIGNEGDDAFTTLTQVFMIPASWIWEAQALYMRSVKHDAPAEVRCLLRAGAYSDAHQCFAEKVAPVAVIERDYKFLASILSEFEGREDSIASWSLGGDVYRDFLSIISYKAKKENVPVSILTKMLSSLPAVQQATPSQNVLSSAAVSEMSTVIARIVNEASQDSLLPRVLALPMMEDDHLKYSIDMSISYYKGIMTR